MFPRLLTRGDLLADLYSQETIADNPDAVGSILSDICNSIYNSG